MPSSFFLVGKEPSENLVSGRLSPNRSTGWMLCAGVLSVMDWSLQPLLSSQVLMTAWGLENALLFDSWDVGMRGSLRSVRQGDTEALFGATLESCNTCGWHRTHCGGLLGGLGTLSFRICIVWSMHTHIHGLVCKEGGWGWVACLPRHLKYSLWDSKYQ